MKESILHYVWQYKLFALQELKTTDGQAVEVIDVGKPNSDSGPDFFNAKIKISDTVWAGNVEIHTLSSDWFRHSHDVDKAYDNVILHIVARADVEVKRVNGLPILQMELQVPETIQQNFDNLYTAKKWIPCEDKIVAVSPIVMSSWKTALLVERLERKSGDIEVLLEQNENHWEEAFYIALARNFGFSTNNQPFELLARSLPLNVLAKHKDNLFQLEALLFGQAGFLEENPQDEYQAKLSKEYRFLQAKYKLTPIDASQWKLLRLRPDNFPHIRIAQFAALTHGSVKLFSKILENTNVGELRKLFGAEVSEYWQHHYVFGKESVYSRKKMGKISQDLLLINTVVPFIFTYAKKKNRSGDDALRILDKLPAENNSVISGWKALGQHVVNAFDSQALLQLKKNYCDEKKCLRCRVGHKILNVRK